MSDDLLNYLWDQLDEQISDLDEVIHGEDGERIEYHMDKIKNILGKLKTGLKKEE